MFESFSTSSPQDIQLLTLPLVESQFVSLEFIEELKQSLTEGVLLRIICLIFSSLHLPKTFSCHLCLWLNPSLYLWSSLKNLNRVSLKGFY